MNSDKSGTDTTCSYDKLLERYHLLLQEVEQLRGENHRLRHLLGQKAEDADALSSRKNEVNPEQYPYIESAAAPMTGLNKVDRFSPPEDKIAFDL